MAISYGKAYFGKDDFMKFWLPEKKAQGSLVKSQGNHNHLIDIVSYRSNKVGHKSSVQKWNPKIKEYMIFIPFYEPFLPESRLLGHPLDTVG